MNTPKPFEQDQNLSLKNNVKQSDLAEVLKESETESKSNLPSISDLPEVVALRKQIENEDKDILEYFEQLVNEVWFDQEKLDRLYEDFISKKVEEVLVKIEKSGYDNEKIEYLLWEEVVRKLNQVKWKVKAIQEGTLTIEEKVNVYPSICTSSIMISSENQFPFKIVDVYGRLITKGTLIGQNIVDCSNWRNGTYFVIINKGKNKMTKRVIKINK